MTFAHPAYLALLLLFLGMGVWAARRRQQVVVSDSRQQTRSGIIARVGLVLPLLATLLIIAILIIALANPETEEVVSHVTLETKVGCLSVDASSSMGFGPSSPMEEARILFLRFANQRLENGDYLCISAYGGWEVSSPEKGNARVIMYPTVDALLVHAAVNSVQTDMFGPYTAIGDGIFVSLVSLIEPQAKDVMGERYDRLALEQSVSSMGTEDENITYAQQVAAAVGGQAGKYVVLFTDGESNTGMSPEKALWFARRLGVKVYFVRFGGSESGVEGLIEGVVKTGGAYRRSDDIAGVKMLFDEINAAERAKIIVESEPRRQSRRSGLFQLAAILFGILVVSWKAWGDPL